MLDSNTKKLIDDLRNILVGKIPSPQSQVEQITTGLIYKFMDDLDREAKEMGGVKSFFVGKYKKYSWEKLRDPKLGGVGRVALYSEAIENMYHNPTAPELFREIFKNAFLPFKDPSTLNMFLQKINEFKYSHSEKLGDAFEYLLSFMGSQGDAGQFRTPRHIIDFIVEIVNPQKHETILDPACGTAGFLISSYKHILTQNTNKKLGDKLTAKERKQLGDNLVGYDISPDMTRISLVNMYLHRFVNPKIYEYDTLSSEERWNEYYDVILANPPFFSPTGGIKPHSRFGVQSTRAEVLFVDYIMEHLKPHGRAGIIIPEGIIFQAGTAYKKLRKKLVEGALVGVISLPAGVFQPYSGVKTSVLILDKKLHKKTENIFFAKVENDGFSLGAQRTPIKKNDLPSVLENFKRLLEFSEKEIKNHLISKIDILSDSTFSLSSGVYSLDSTFSSRYEMVQLGSLVDLQNGYAFPSKDYVEESEVMSFRMSQIRPGGSVDLLNNPKFLPPHFADEYSKFLLAEGDVVIAMTDMASDPKILGVPTIIPKSKFSLLLNQRVGKFFNLDNKKAIYNYIGWILKSENARKFFKNLGTGGVQINIGKNQILEIKIPLPPIEIQQQIVAELEGYQKIIDGCRQVVENYQPTIDIDPSWEMVELGEVFLTSSGGTPKANEEKYYLNGNIPWVRSGEVDSQLILATEIKITELGLKESSAKLFPANSVLVAMYGATAGKVGILGIKAATNQAVCAIFPNEKCLPKFLYYILRLQEETLIGLSVGGAQPNISQTIIKNFKIPLPPIEVQQQIVAELEGYQKTIEGNKKLIEIYTQKIHAKISKIWGE